MRGRRSTISVRCSTSLPASGIFTNERFTVVAARGGNDIWIEIRRHRPSDDTAGREGHTAGTGTGTRAATSRRAAAFKKSGPWRAHTVRLSQSWHTAGIDRLLRIAAARGASTLYLTSQARPSIRVDGEISAIEGEAVLSEPDVEALMLDIIPERNRETLRSQAGTEWICDVPDVGRIRCVTFRDHRGAGGIFRHDSGARDLG